MIYLLVLSEFVRDVRPTLEIYFISQFARNQFLEIFIFGGDKSFVEFFFIYNRSDTFKKKA